MRLLDVFALLGGVIDRGSAGERNGCPHVQRPTLCVRLVEVVDDVRCELRVERVGCYVHLVAAKHDLRTFFKRSELFVGDARERLGRGALDCGALPDKES